MPEKAVATDHNRQSKPVTLRYRVEYLGFLTIRVLIRALPFKFASRISATLWRVIAPKIYRHDRALKHLRLAYPEKTETEREAIAISMWANLGRTMAESFVIDRIAKRRDMFEFVIPPPVKAMIDSGSPMIVTTLHLGNWEMLGVGAAMLGVELSGIYQRILNPLVDDAVIMTRSPFYRSGLFAKGHESVRNLMRLLRSGKSIAVVSDLRDHGGLKIPFFGHDANSSPFPAMMSVLYGAPIIATRCLRLAPDRFLFEMKHIDIQPGRDRDETIFNRTAAIHAQFEEWIRQNPDQWMWAHRRWD